MRGLDRSLDGLPGRLRRDCLCWHRAAARAGSSGGRRGGMASAASQAPMPPTGAGAADAASAQPAGVDADPIVQWVVLRKDLWGDLGWPLGPVIAQACHACSAAAFSHLDDEATRAYLAPDAIDNMHKVVLEVKGEAQLLSLAGKLQEAGIQHRLWVEQPENYATCLATKPYRRSEGAPHFKKLQLCKAVLAK